MAKKIATKDDEDSSGDDGQGKLVVYHLDIRMPDAPPQRIQVKGKLMIGQSDTADIHIKGRGLLSKHAIFRINNDVLSIHNFSPETSLNGQKLAPGRMYIVAKGDKLNMGQLDIIIRHDEVENHELETPQTNIKSILKYKDELEQNKAEENSKNAGFLNKIKGLFKKNSSSKKAALVSNEDVAEKKPLKKAGAGKPHYKVQKAQHPSPPGPFLRALAFPGTLSAIYLVLFGILPWQHLDGAVFDNELLKTLHNFLQQKIAVLITTHPTLTTHFTLLQDLLGLPTLAFLIIYAALEIFSHLVAGASFGHVLVGIDTDDSFFMKRVKSMGRLILWPISCATIVGELLPIAGVRTLKEILTASYPHPKSIIRRLLSVFIFIPLLVVLAPTAALFLDQDFWEGTWEIATPVSRQTSTNMTKLDSFFFSATFEVQKDSDLIFLPIIQTEKLSESSFLILDTKKNQQVHVRRWIPPKLSFAEFQSANPILPLLHPDLEKTADADMSLANTILGFAFSIKLDNLLDYTLEFGPFTYGLTKIRQEFKMQFQIQGRPEIYRLPAGKTDLWAIRESELKERNQFYLWNLDQTAPSFKIEYDKGSAAFALTVVNRIMRSMQFKSGIKLVQRESGTVSESALFIMDYMLEPPKKELLPEIQTVTRAMKSIKTALPKEGIAPKNWDETKKYLLTRWTKIPPPSSKDKTALKNWQKALEEFKKL